MPDFTDPQTLNRFSYARNNPLNYLDPSGHSFGDFFDQLIGAVVGTAVSIVSGNPALGFAIASGITSGLTASKSGGNILESIGIVIATSGLGSLGGNFLGAALKSNFIGAVAGGSISSSTSAILREGDIGRSALAGATSSALGYLGPVGALIGGGASAEIAGGDFMDGVAGAACFLFANTLAQSIDTEFNRIPQGINTLSNTSWANSGQGSQIVGALKTAQWRGLITYTRIAWSSNQGIVAGDFDWRESLMIRINSMLGVDNIPSSLAHEGTHLLDFKNGLNYGFRSERSAYDNGYIVDQQLNGQGGSGNPSDSWIKNQYEF